MTNKMKLLIGLLVVGIALVVTGIVLAVLPGQDKVNIPEGSPVIYEQARYLMGGANNELFIYDDGSIIYIEEKGLRFPMPERPATRTWRTGKLTGEQLDSLVDYLNNSGLDKLDEYYNYTTKPDESGSFSSSDMGFTITVNSGNLSKTVKTFGYMSPDNGETYPDMPAPLNDIYARLRTIAMATQEVYQESISQ